MLMLDRSAARRWGTASPRKAVSSIITLVGLWGRIVIEIIQRAMMKPKRVIAAPWGSTAGQYGLHAEWPPRCSPAAWPRRSASLTALLHELPRFPAGGAA